MDHQGLLLTSTVAELQLTKARRLATSGADGQLVIWRASARFDTRSNHHLMEWPLVAMDDA